MAPLLSMASRILLIVLLGGMLATPPIRAQTPEAQADQEERHFFDFLIGEWVLERKVTPDASWEEGKDNFTFEKVLDGAGILSEWYFNRGTPEDPNYTRGMYMSAFDEMTGTWSFYYISPQNAMYYQGRKENGQWYFYKTFHIDGEELLQRQSWTPRGSSTLVRTIENSRDGGETWGEVYQTTLKRKE